MIVTLPTVKGDIKIELLERDAPLAVRAFREQIRRGAWTGAAVTRTTPAFIVLSGSSPISIGVDSRRSRPRRGAVAYVRSGSASDGDAVNTRELVIFLSAVPGKAAVFGQLSGNSLSTVEAIAGSARDGETPLNPVTVLPSRRQQLPQQQAEPSAKRRFNLALPKDLDNDEDGPSEAGTGIRPLYLGAAPAPRLVASKEPYESRTLELQRTSDVESLKRMGYGGTKDTRTDGSGPNHPDSENAGPGPSPQLVALLDFENRLKQSGAAQPLFS